MSIATWQLTRIDLFTDKEWVSLIVAIWAGAIGLVSSPVICMSLDNLRPEEAANSSSIKNLARVLPGAICGGVIGIASERAADTYFDALRDKRARVLRIPAMKREIVA